MKTDTEKETKKCEKKSLDLDLKGFLICGGVGLAGLAAYEFTDHKPFGVFEMALGGITSAIYLGSYLKERRYATKRIINGMINYGAKYAAGFGASYATASIMDVPEGQKLVLASILGLIVPCWKWNAKRLQKKYGITDEEINKNPIKSNLLGLEKKVEK
jgi:hypothetical protein